MREKREKAALALHRYKNWLEIIETKTQELAAIRQQMDVLVEQIVYAHLEAREEQEHLIQFGLDQKNIENVGKIPHLNLDPLTILRRVGGGDDRLLERDGDLSQEGPVPHNTHPVSGNTRPKKMRRMPKFPDDSGVSGSRTDNGHASQVGTQKDRDEAQKKDKR